MNSVFISCCEIWHRLYLYYVQMCPGYSASTEAFTAFERHSFIIFRSMLPKNSVSKISPPTPDCVKVNAAAFSKIYADDHLRLPAVYTDSEQYSTSYGRGEYYYDCRTCRIFLTGILWPDFQALHGHVTQSVGKRQMPPRVTFR